MTFWDHATVVYLAIAAASLIVHAVMVGNPAYGWQPRSLVVRFVMIVFAVLVLARAAAINENREHLDVTAVRAAGVMAFLFFASWLDMMVSSWRKRADEAEAAGAETVGQVVGARIDETATLVARSAEVSESNAEKLDRIERSVAILDPAPFEFREPVRKAAGLP